MNLSFSTDHSLTAFAVFFKPTMKSPRLLLVDVQKVGTVMQYLYIAIKITIKQCFLYSSSVNNIAK